MATCGAKAAACACVKEPGHVEAGDEVHACDEATCGGKWKGEGDTFDVVEFPHPERGPLAFLFGEEES